MDWLVTIVFGALALVLVAPVVMLLLTFFVLVPLAHLAPAPSMLAQSTFRCPFSKRIVHAAFLTSPSGEHPADVVECSLFADGQVRCKKGCLAMAASGWTPSPVVPRWALIADGAAYR